MGLRISTVEQLAVQVEPIRQARPSDELAGGGVEIEDLLKRSYRLPDSAVQEWMRTYRQGTRT